MKTISQLGPPPNLITQEAIEFIVPPNSPFTLRDVECPLCLGVLDRPLQLPGGVLCCTSCVCAWATHSHTGPTHLSLLYSVASIRCHPDHQCSSRHTEATGVTACLLQKMPQNGDWCSCKAHKTPRGWVQGTSGGNTKFLSLYLHISRQQHLEKAG